MNTKQLANHIISLLLQHTIAVTWKDGTSGRAWVKTRRVRLRPVKTQKTYAVALHEIGHIVGDQPKARLDREAAAWEWAMRNALKWTRITHATMQRCLQSYMDAAQRKRYRPSPRANRLLVSKFGQEDR